MAGLQKQFLMDPTVPRPAPRFPLIPTPFTFEKPVPQVPDVSLIFDSSAASNKSANHNLSSSSANHNVSSVSANPNVSSGSANAVPLNPLKQTTSFEIQVLYDAMKRQEETIQRVEKKLQAITDNQEEQSQKFQRAMEIIIARLLVKTSENAAQTDKDILDPLINAKDRNLKNLVSMEVQTDAIESAVESIRGSSSSGSSLSIPSSPGRSDSMGLMKATTKQFANIAVDDNENKVEDLSTILKDLQLPTIRENSIFSEVSVKSIPLQDFNESLSESELGSPRVGASASNYASSDEEEVVQPTFTFYRNVIGNVNKMLDNSNREVTVYDSTDTTIYGMSSTNLSFATKQYLQKYGLVKQTKSKPDPLPAPAPAHPTRNPAGHRIFSDEELPCNRNDSNRVLDVTTLKNQPKLL